MTSFSYPSLARHAASDSRDRLIEIDCALPSFALMPERMVLREAVSQPFELALDALSTSDALLLDPLVGEPVTVRLQQSDGHYRPLHGHVFEAARLASVGGLSRLRLVIRPWLSFAALRHDACVWQDRTALEIVEALFENYPQARYRFDVTEPLRRRSLCIQYRESDLDFISRLLAGEGLGYHFEHRSDDESALPTSGAQGAYHVLVVTDRASPRPHLGTAFFTSSQANVALPLCLTPGGGNNEVSSWGGSRPATRIEGQRDAVTAFSAARQLQPNAVTVGSWNYRSMAGTTGHATRRLFEDDLPPLEHYDGTGAYRFASSDHADKAAALALAAIELDVEWFEGQGSLRHFEAGRHFRLVDHPLFSPGFSAHNSSGAGDSDHPPGKNDFLLLAVELHAANNLGAEIAELVGSTELERGTWKSHFHAAPAAAAVVPRHLRKPTAPGAQTAVVVGVHGEALTTDRDHRVKVQFPWQRGAAPVAGGLTLEGIDEAGSGGRGNAPGDESSGTWVRVAVPAAGANWGAVLLPRIGTEVLVEFIEGDIDRPIVVGQLYNGVDLPPFSAGVDSAADHAGVISGLQTCGLDGAGFNQWVIDDTTGQLRMRLLTSTTEAELGLGHLVFQRPASAGRGNWRGAGFEAVTQAWATARAGQGLLLSTQARAGTYGSAQGTQMDASDALAGLRAAVDLGSRLGRSAAASTAQPLSSFVADGPVARLADSIDPDRLGRHDAMVNGQQALGAGPEGRRLAQPVAAFQSPAIVMETPTAAFFASDAGITAFSGLHLSLAAETDMQQTAGATYSAVSGQTTSLFAAAGGVKAIAANGPVSLRAHTDALSVLADAAVEIVSVNDSISIRAATRIELVAGHSAIILEGADITFVTPGKFEAKFSTHAFVGADGAPATLHPWPDVLTEMAAT